MVLGTKDTFLILTIGWQQPIMLGKSQRLPPAQLPSREVGKGWGLGNEQEWGGGRSSLESPGVCASVRLCVCAFVHDWGGGWAV